ncbi:MAG: hypothetical protein NTX61_08220 [Bacteroidetes bacterium]|nr:hypothetical protein [Bacteroidota bacterium]
MNREPRVLVAAPTSDYKSYCFDLWRKGVKALTYKNVGHLLIDNGHCPDPQLKKHFPVFYLNPGTMSRRQVMADSQQLIKIAVLKQGYDYWLSLETDMIPPIDIIQRLLSLHAPVAAAVYFIGQGDTSELMIQQVEPLTPAPVAFPLTQKEGFLAMTGHPEPVYHPGLGCALIRADVLKQVNFYVTAHDRSHADSYFYADLYRLNIPVILDTSIICTHYNSDWQEIYKKDNERTATDKKAG